MGFRYCRTAGPQAGRQTAALNIAGMVSTRCHGVALLGRFLFYGVGVPSGFGVSSGAVVVSAAYIFRTGLAALERCWCLFGFVPVTTSAALVGIQRHNSILLCDAFKAFFFRCKRTFVVARIVFMPALCTFAHLHWCR
jgi:hypothetical protein